MALITPGPLAGQISGRLASTIFSHNKGGPYVRNGTIPTTSTTEYALAAKAALQAASATWQGFTAAQRLAWSSFALENPVTNRLGKSITLSGIAAHNGIFCRLTAAGLAPIAAPPIDPAPSPLLTLVQTCDRGLTTFDLVYTATPLAATHYLWIQACVNSSPAVNYVENRLRLIGISAAAQASPFDHEALLTARLGAQVDDQSVTVLVSVLDSATGLLSTPLRDTALVATTA